MGLFKSASNAGRDRPGLVPRSNIRGKISGPIPIPDDEFPMRTSDPSTIQEETENLLSPEPQRDSIAVSTNIEGDGTGENRTDSLVQSVPSQGSTTSTPTRRRTNRSSTLRYSTLSETTDTASPSRKKSSFRTAIGKLFRKRNKKQGNRSVSDSEAQVDPSNDHHRSEPVARDQEPAESDGEPKRSASFPITELNEALRSHSIGPDDYMAIHSARNSLQSDSVFLRKRAATTSGVPISPGLRDENGDVLGLSPRPVSTHGQDTTGAEDPESIGRAVSVDCLASRRRSRSLSQLRDISEGQVLFRKRSDEIRFWRASHNLGPLSSNPSISNRDEPETATTTGANTETQEELQSAIPPEPFNFLSLNSMRITQAASLEERVSLVEAQNQKLERLISQLFQVVPGIDHYSDALSHPASLSPIASPPPHAITGLPTANPPKPQNLPIRAEPLSPDYSASEQSNVSFEDEKTFIGSLRQSAKEPLRPVSNVTIRGTTSLPSLPRDAAGAFTADQYNTLRALLDAERAARQALQTRVAKLTHMVDTMSRTMPKPDATPLSGIYANVSAFEHDDDDDYATDPPSVMIDDDATDPPSVVIDDDTFGQDTEADASRKRAARTLSLGQLTLGKPKNTRRSGAGVGL